MNNFTLMILAAGFGKRMENLTKDIPKPLLKVNSKTLLSNTIHFFEKLGCNKFVINTHYLHNQLNDYVEKYLSHKNIYLSFESEILDTGGGIKNAINYFDNKKLLVTNSDIFWNSNNENDVIKFISKINKTKECLLLLSKQLNTIGINRDFGDFVLENSCLRRWRKNDPIFFYSGLQILNPKIIEEYDGKKFSINKVWDNLINKNKLQGAIMESELFHIGDKKTYNKFI